MRPEVEELVNAVLNETDCIDDLIDAIREQREAMRERDNASVNDIMNEISNLSFEMQAQETLRNDIARKLAAKFSCEPKANSLAEKMPEDEREIFNEAADKLTQSVFVLKSEIMILSGLIDQNEKYTSMLLSEWRRLNGDNVSQSGAADFRG